MTKEFGRTSVASKVRPLLQGMLALTLFAFLLPACTFGPEVEEGPYEEEEIEEEIEEEEED